MISTARSPSGRRRSITYRASLRRMAGWCCATRGQRFQPVMKGIGRIRLFRKGRSRARRNEATMERAPLSRRSLLHAIAATFASAALPLDWTDLAEAVEQAGATPSNTIAFLSAAEAADIE